MRKCCASSALALVVTFSAAGGSLALARSGGSVVVPRVKGTEVSVAYARLHRAGLRVSIRRGFLFRLDRGDVLYPELVLRTSPRSGRSVARGSVVRVVLHCDCREGHIPPPRHTPTYRVADFNGRRLGLAYRWARPKILVFWAQLGALRAGDARTLFANYRIEKQSPRSGAKLSYYAFGAWTPLKVTAQQTS